MQLKGDSGPGLVFHLLDPGYILLASSQGWSPRSLSQAGQPALCRAINTQPSRQASAFVPALWETFMWLQEVAYKAEGLDNSRVFGKFSSCSPGLLHAQPLLPTCALS